MMLASTLSCSAFSVATRSFSPALRLSNPSPSAYRASPCRIFTRLQWGGALEKQPGTALDTLYGLEYYTFRRIDRRSVRRIGVSFNGRTADSGSANWGSNPCTPARLANTTERPCYIRNAYATRV